jgi:dihydrofolate reductase
MKASVFVGTSLDGFIARQNGEFDFLLPFDEPHGYEEFIASVDALVIGRNTYDVVRKFEKWPYGDKKVFVLSSHAIGPAPSGASVEHLLGEPKNIFAELEARGFKHIYVDGGITIQRFLRAGLIQRLIITRVPVLIGEGIPLFGNMERDIKLKHIETREFASGIVQSEYEIFG